MPHNRSNPAVGAAGSGKICSSLASLNTSDNKPAEQQGQAENDAPATAPGLLDLNYLNVELDLRLAAVKSIQAATDLELGEPDDIAGRNILVAISQLRDAAKRFREIKETKTALGDAIIAGACR